MNSGNYENKILDAIQRIVDNAVSHASYDKTIKGMIVKVADEDTGKYLIKYQDSSFYAYSNDNKISYSVDDMVYVLIPGNDMTQMKTIIGAVDKIGINYIDTIESQDAYDIIGNNIIDDHGNGWGLCSYKPSGDAIVLYDKDNLPASFLDIDAVAANTYLKQAKYLVFGGNFQTMLDPEQKFQGNFGLALELSFLDNNTGETVDRVYKIDINEMTGNPYEYLNATEQFVAFQIDGENFQSINKITFFSYDFPIEDEEKTLLDIFASNIFLKGADKLSEDELRGNSIKLITPQGIYFDNNDAATASRNITAEVRIDGTLLSNNSNRTKYYWFRQNSKVSRDSETFQRYGGIGWECLNEYTTITEEGVQLREWTPASANFSVTKGNSLAKENVYKCVAVYNDNIILSKEITFYNYSSAFDITVVSDSGEYFSYDVGNPTLTCYVNGSVPTDTQSVVWTYAWMVKDNNNIDSLLTETTSDNTTYNNAVTAYNELKTGLENGTILLTQETQEQLVSLANTISGYDSIMRVEANNIYKVKLNTITNFSTYTCFVYRNNIFVGKASITITNDLAKNRNAYTLVINNGNQVFKYNENGIAPTSKSLDKVQELYPLSFTLFDDAGKEIDNNAIKARDVEWTVPTTNTLINISPTHGNPSSVDTINETATYKNYKELYFTIANVYNANKDRNTIQLKVKYKDRVVVTKTDLLFMKEGEVGTNGTDFVCRITPNTIDNTIPKYPTVIYNKNAAISATNPRLNFTPASENLWFKAELWHDGVKIFDGVTTGQSGESKQVKVEWEILKNKYASNVIDVSNFIVNKTTGAFEFNNLSAISDTTLKANPANIVKCTLTYDGIEYYATMPITLVTTTAAKYRAELEELSGFRYVMYTTDGAKPIYDSANPFALRVYQTDNNIEQDISQTILSDYSVDYTWSVKGLSYGASSWNAEANLIEKTLYSDTLEKNQKRFIPIDTCNGYAVNNALYCSVTRDGTELMSIHIPIHLYLNKYGNAALNGWDGNHIEINEDGGFILAPQIGAGKKNQDNSFTGVFMGSVKEAGKSKEEYGLYGYNAGERTIALNAEDGSARFGKAGMGQIVLDPTDNTATLKSSGYVAPVLDEYGNIVTPGQGLEIDLTDPHITFGSGNFRVDSDGQVYATGFATIAALNAGDIDIPGAENFKLEYATDTVQIETDANLDPIEATVTKTITCKCLYKNTYTSDYTVNLIDENGNVITHNANSDGIGVSVSKSGNVATITFTALSSRQISHAVNSYLFRFTYTQKANTKIDKTFNANLVIQGKDGERGATGPVGPAGRDGTSVTVKGSYNSLSDLTTAASTGVITPVAGDGYIIGNDLYVFTNGAGGGGSQAGDWTDVGQFKGDDAKNCVIAASAQVFKSTDGTNYAPNNITLTPYLWAVTFDKWQYVINNGTPQDLNGTLPTGISINSTTKVLTITKDCALFNNSSAITFKCLTDDNNVYDTVTIIKVTDGIDGEDGSDGESAYSVILTNEAQTIAGDNTKALATTITTGVIGYLGSTKKNTSIGTITIKDASGQTIPSSAISAEVSNNNTQNTTITFTVTNQLTVKNGQATIPVTIDSTTINKIFTFSLALKGSDGKGITTVTNYYATSNNGSTAPTGSAWKTDISQLTPLSASNKYLWNYESVTYTSGDPVETDPTVIGVYGDTGLSSTDGMPNIPPIRRWTFDKVAVKVINNEAKNCYLENNNDAYNFIQQGSSQIINQYSMAVFDGTQVVRTDSSNINFNNNVSISFWLNPGNVNTTQTILQNRVNTTQGLSIFLVNKQLRFDLGGGSNTFNYNLNANTNYHIVLTYNKTTGQKKLYVNGQLQQTSTITHTDQTFTNYLWIGKSSTDGTSFGGNVLVGTLDDLRIYDYVLDLDNVDFLYRSNGQEAANGDNGRGLSSVIEYYLAYNSNEGVTKGTSGWTTSIQTVTSSNKYLWNYERINYTDGSWSETNPVIIGTYGDKGDKGDAGDSAVNILLTNEAQVIAGDTSKAIATTITTDVLGFIGSTQVATTVTTADISNLPTGMTANASNHDNISTITFHVTTSMTSKSGQVTIPVKVTVNNVEMTINKIFSYSLSLKGATGGAGTAASMVDISTTSQVFKSLDGGTTYSPNEITLTPRFQTVSYQDDSSHGWFYSVNGGASWTKVSSGTNGLTISGNNLKISKTSALFSSSVTSIVFKCISSNTSVFDTITIVRLSDGTNGNDAYTVVLSNESHTFPATNSAAIASSVDVDVIAYKGAASVIPTIGEITGQVTGLTASVSGTTITISATTSLTTQSGTLTIPVTVDGKSFTKKFSWSLAKAGANGTSPTAYSLIVSHAAVTKAASGTYSPASITLTAKSQTGNAAISNFTTGRYAIFLNGSSTATTTVASTANYSYTIPADTTSIRIALYNSSTGTTILDEQTIPVVLDGINGTSPFISYLTNETQSFVYAKAVSIETSLYGYQGTTEKTVQIKTINGVAAATTDTATGKTGMNFKVSSTSAVAHPKITFTTTTSLPQGASEKLAIVYRVTGESSDRTIYFTYSTTTRGAAGTNASLVDISTSSQIFKSTDGGINFAPNNITLTPRFQTVTYSKWQYTIDGGSNWIDVTSGSHGLTISGNNLTISKDSDLYTESLTAIPFKCVSSNSSIYDVMTIAKLYDVGDFEIGGKNLLLKAQAKIYGSGISGESLDNSNYLYDGSLIYTRPAVSNQGFYVTQYDLMEPDTDYLVSFKAKVTNGTVNQFYMFGTSPNNIASSYLIIDGVKKSASAKDTSITVDLSDGKYHNFIWGFKTSATITTGNYTGNILQWNKTNTTAFTVELKGLKWERGSKPTDWSPAPEDINTNITAAQTTANSAQTLATQVQTDLNDLSIGGRNYLRGYVSKNGSSSPSLSKWINFKYEIDSTAPSGYRMSFELYDNTANARAYIGEMKSKLSALGIKDGDVITVSYYVKSDSTTINQTDQGYLECLTNSKVIENPVVNTTWQRMSYTGIYSNSTTYQALYLIRSQVWSSMAVGEHLYISSIQIEKGNRPTDWKPTKEDILGELESSISTINNDLEDIQDQIDGQVITWFYSGAPTKDNAPANTWTTNTQKDAHIGDYYYNTSNGDAYRYSARDTWTKVSSAVAAALTAGTNAQITADSKRQIFYGSTTPTGTFDEGDMWSNGTDLKIYHNSSWVLATDYTNFKLSDIQLGGRNLVLNSNFDNNMDKWSNWGSPATREIVTINNKKWLHCITTSSNYQGLSQNRYSLLSTSDLKPNTKYTLSFTMYGKEAYTGSVWGIHWKNEPETGSIISQVASGNVDITTTPQRYSWTVTSPNNAHNFNLMVGKWTGTITPEFWITDIKFEESNIVSNWSAAPEDTTSYVDNLVADLQIQVDGKIQTYSQITDPSTNWTAEEKIKHTGDLWYNSSTKITKRWSGSAWTEINNAEAEAAATLAASKAQVFTSTPTIPYYKGDLWITALNQTGVVKTCKTSRTTGSYTTSDWVEGLKYTDDTLATTANNKIDNLKVGGRNYILESNIPNRNKSTTSYPAAIYDLATDENQESYIKAGKQYTWTVIGNFTNASRIDMYFGGGTYGTTWQNISGDGDATISRTFTANSNHAAQKNVQIYVRDANDGKPGEAVSIIYKVKLEEGNKPTDWTPAPEDIEASIAKTVATVDVEYYLSTKSTETTGGSWSTSAPTWVDGKYMWSRQKVTYVDGTSITRNETCIAGAKGNTGTSITISSTSVTYQASSSGTTTPTGTWSSTVPSVTNGQFLWTRTIVTYSDNTKTTAYAVAYKGTNGTNGTNSYTYIRYSASADGTDMSTDPTGKSYIGVYTGTSSTAPSSKTSYTWSKYVGDKGAAGNGITSITYYYKATTTQTAPSASSITSTTIPTLSATNKYLWQKEVIDFSDSGVADKTTVLLLGVYGDTGVTGTGISSITEQYYLSTSKDQAPAQDASGWSNTPPAWQVGKYIWTRSKIVYTNPSSTQYTTPICSSEWEAINDIKVGGRNLLIGTDNPVKATGTGGTNQCTNLYNFSQYYMDNYYSKTATAGESLQLTVSYDWISTATSGTFRNQVNGSPYAGSGNPLITLSESNTSGHISHVWTLSKGTNATNYTKIQVRLDNVTGNITFSNFKIEIGNKETDWSLAPEDVASDIGEGVISAVAQYAANDSNITPPPNGDEYWNENTPTTSETNKYIWMRMYITYINGEDYTSTPICISYYERKLIRTSIEYAASTDSVIAPSTGWSENKPDDTSKYIWTREANYYSSEPLIEHSTPSCDTLVKTLQNNITKSANGIIKGLKEEGAIRIFDNKIYIVNDPVISDASQAIMIGKDGIAFARNPNAQALGWVWDDEKHTNGHFTNEDHWTSTWSIAGDFNAQDVEVKNLTANDIQDGTLSLGRSANTSGKLEVYTTNGQIATVTIDGDGIIVKNGNTIKAKLLKTGGLIIYDKSGAKAYGSTSDETAFETNTIIVKKEIDFGTDIKGLVMQASVNGTTHKGIGFIKM